MPDTVSYLPIYNYSEEDILVVLDVMLVHLCTGKYGPLVIKKTWILKRDEHLYMVHCFEVI